MNLKRLSLVQKWAKHLQHWETVRDCDFHLCVATQSQSLFEKLYFGSTSPFYRSRIVNKVPEFSLPTKYQWRFGNTSKKSQFSLDTKSGVNSQSKIQLKTGFLPQRLLASLSSDFYRPQRMASLFNDVFPNEQYHPVYSPNRIHQGLSQLRHWITEAKIPLDIDEQASAYRLITQTYAQLTTYRETYNEAHPILSGPSYHEYKLLKDSFGTERKFSAKMASEKLSNKPIRSVNRILKSLVETGVLSKVGAGPSTEYLFLKN